MVFLFSILACSPEYYEFSGSVAEASFTPTVGYFGGEYLIFLSEPLDCKELYWVTKIYRNGESPYEQSLKAIQISFNDSNVVEDTVSLGGNASATTQFLDISGDSFSVTKATEGTVRISEVDGENFAEGTLDATFGSDIINASFNTPWCPNLVR